MSIAKCASIQSALTACHLGPISLAPGMCGYWAAVCRNAASLSFSTENLVTFVASPSPEYVPEWDPF
ncbi:hypothetical protein K469DRAFT_705747 [Zopfia rhizophila CBS 207.26]|uniref:Uncharacterized protein n=1 Tax=Zopfia rhizophila CBS 207.26 TaxID=1314779 RepID=A0A6A6EBI0_9PEZI|nr:hypothetical protein K469DRAFT_705747 [Zopfia rhizophila CBS 207.26]